MQKGTIVRTALLIFALVNQCLTMAGHSMIPISDEELSELVSLIFTTVTALMGWWKNNSFTPNAIKADEYLSKLKEEEKQ